MNRTLDKNRKSLSPFHSGALALLLLCASAVRGETDAIVIPIELKDGNNFTSILIGDVSLKAVIDTGGWHEIGITSEALTKLHVRFTGTTTERTDGGGNKFRGPEFRIPVLQLGGHTFRDILGFERHQAASGDFGGPPLFDALIGRDFLQRYTVVVDYPRQRIELHPAARALKVCGQSIATILPTSNGFMFSVVQTDSGAMNLGWDTGATYSFIQKTLANARQLALDDDLYSTQRFTLANLDAGPMDMVAIELGGVPEVDGLIGFNFFEKHRVCFDYKKRTVNVR